MTVRLLDDDEPEPRVERVGPGVHLQDGQHDVAVRPTAEYPPLFPAVLSLVSRAGGRTVAAQRIDCVASGHETSCDGALRGAGVLGVPSDRQRQPDRHDVEEGCSSARRRGDRNSKGPI